MELTKDLHSVGGKEQELLMTLDLQYFADGGEGGDGGTPPADPATPPADPATPPAPAEQPKGDKDKDGFTQDDVNAIAAREAKKAQEKLLKQLGIEDFDGAKEGMQKFKEWQESQKTEAEKQTEAFQNAQKELDNYKGQVGSLQAEIAALKNDVNPDSLSDVVLLASNMVKANGEITIDDYKRGGKHHTSKDSRTTRRRGDVKSPGHQRRGW